MGKIIKYKFLATALAAALVTSMAHADAGVGAGLTYVFGEGFAVGLKVFTDDEEDKGVGSVGLDYMVGSGAWRPNVGVGYLGDNIYGDLTAGYNLQSSSWNFGIGAGVPDTEQGRGRGRGRGGF